MSRQWLKEGCRTYNYYCEIGDLCSNQKSRQWLKEGCRTYNYYCQIRDLRSNKLSRTRLEEGCLFYITVNLETYGVINVTSVVGGMISYLYYCKIGNLCSNKYLVSGWRKDVVLTLA